MSLNGNRRRFFLRANRYLTFMELVLTRNVLLVDSAAGTRIISFAKILKFDRKGVFEWDQKKIHVGNPLALH